MNKDPTSFIKYAIILEEELYETVEDLKDMTDEDWRFFDHKEHKIPLKIINEIKNRISRTQS